MAKAKQRIATNFFKIEKLWNAGKSYQQMADALGIKGTDKADPTKPMRAKVSLLLNTGWNDPETGKRHFLKPRDGMRAIGVGKTVKKTAKAVAHRSPKKAAKAAKKSVAVKTAKKGKAVVIGMHSSGKYLRVEVGDAKALIDTTQGNTLLIDALHQQGYDVIQKVQAPEAPGPVEAAPADEVAAAEKTAEATEATPANTVTSTEGPLAGVLPVTQTPTGKDAAA